MSQCVWFPTMWYVRPAKPQISLRIRAVWSEPLLVAWVFYDCSATDWTPFGVFKFKGGCRCSSESTHVKIPHCWKYHALAHKAYLCSHVQVFNQMKLQMKTPVKLAKPVWGISLSKVLRSISCYTNNGSFDNILWWRTLNESSCPHIYIVSSLTSGGLDVDKINKCNFFYKIIAVYISPTETGKG